MAESEETLLLHKGAEAWNAWREANPSIRPDLGKAKLNGANLGGALLRGVNLGEANLSRANLRNAVIGGSDLSGADFSWANLGRANLARAKLQRRQSEQSRRRDRCPQRGYSGVHDTWTVTFRARPKHRAVQLSRHRFLAAGVPSPLLLEAGHA